MRLFQNISIYDGYRARLDGLAGPGSGYVARLEAFLNDRYSAGHILKPVGDKDPEAFLAVGNDATSQRAWARERGFPASTPLAEIMLAQIEEHRAEVFYNLDPIRFGNEFVARLPSCVKRHVAWRAAPSPHENFDRYDCVVSNFPAILRRYETRGFRTAYFFPAHDPEMDTYARRTDRPIDILFVGGYSRHHQRRAEILLAVAALADHWDVRFHLDRSRLTRLAETPLGALPPLRRHRRPIVIRNVARPGVFGRALYEVLGSSKVVLNAAVDMAGEERGNMRCFETMGCGALLLSDEGAYPEGMVPGGTLITYCDAADAAKCADDLLSDGEERRKEVARRGHEMIRERYSRERQWQMFLGLCG
jgi:glycosyltransferase involved in cell wall biosynthesis